MHIHWEKQETKNIFWSLCFFMHEEGCLSHSFSHEQYLQIALSSPTPKALRTREVSQKRLGPQVPSFTSTPVFPLSPRSLCEFNKKSNSVWVLHERKWNTSKQTGNTVLQWNPPCGKGTSSYGQTLRPQTIWHVSTYPHTHTHARVCTHTCKHLSQLSEIRVSFTWTLGFLTSVFLTNANLKAFSEFWE